MLVGIRTELTSVVQIPTISNTPTLFAFTHLPLDGVVFVVVDEPIKVLPVVIEPTTFDELVRVLLENWIRFSQDSLFQ